MNDSTLLGVELTTELLNERLEGYRVLRQVGHGAMGIVFEARQRGLDRRVAVKFLPPALAMRDRTVRRFLREAEAMGRLAHTNIVDVYEVGSLGSLHYFAMRFVDGPPLDVVLKAGVLGIGDVVQVGIDVAAALAHAHARGVLHRDVKPSNLLRDGERVVLTDFGLAKPIDSDEEGAMTESGDLVGTPLYMSPEQISGSSEGIDGRSDVWGLGATLYELLIGRPPFVAGSPSAILNAILHKDPPLLRRQRADVPADLEAVVLKCLEKDPGRRYSGAAGLHADLLAIQAGASVSARPPRFFDPAVRWSRRHPWQTAALAVSFAVFGFFGAQWRTNQKKLKESNKQVETVSAERKQAREGKAEAIAGKELLAALGEFDRAVDERARFRAFERLSFLMEAIEFEKYPQLATEIMRATAACAHKLGQDEKTQAGFDASIYGASTSNIALAMRGAMLEGMERLEEALIVHQQRMRIFTTSPAPWFDAAKVLRALALRDSSTSGDAEARRRLTQAVQLHDRALQRAVRAGDEDMTAVVLIERARCLLDMNQPAARLAAEKSLHEALDHDPTRADASALLEACKRGFDDESASPQVAPVATEGSSTQASPVAVTEPPPSAKPKPDKPAGKGLTGIPLVDRMQGSLELDKADLANAGKNLTSIYRGLRDVLRTAASGAAPGSAATSAGAPATGVQQN